MIYDKNAVIWSSEWWKQAGSDSEEKTFFACSFDVKHWSVWQKALLILRLEQSKWFRKWVTLKMISWYLYMSITIMMRKPKEEVWQRKQQRRTILHLYCIISCKDLDGPLQYPLWLPYTHNYESVGWESSGSIFTFLISISCRRVPHHVTLELLHLVRVDSDERVKGSARCIVSTTTIVLLVTYFAHFHRHLQCQVLRVTIGWILCRGIRNRCSQFARSIHRNARTSFISPRRTCRICGEWSS